MMLQWLQQNWEVVCVMFGLFVNALALAYNVWKYVSAGGLRRTDKLLSVLEAARVYEQEAERMTGYSGAEKLQYVLSRLRIFTADVGYPYNEDELRAAVEADIAFSKAVNADKSERLE
jgi:hypothetical protein